MPTWGWIIVGGITLLAAVLGAWLLLRNRSRPPLFDSDRADRERDRIRDHADAERERVKAEVESVRDRLHDKFLLILLAVFVARCSSAPVAPVIKPDPLPHKAFVSALVDDCEAEGDHVVCPVDTFVAGVDGCLSLLEGFGICRVDLQQCRALSIVDKDELEASVRQAERDRDAAKRERWYWGLGGLGLGAIVTGLVVGFAR